MNRRKNTHKDQILPFESRLLLCRTEDGRTRIEVRLQEESVWLNQSAMTKLFQSTKQNISLHLRNIFNEGELAENRVVKEYLTTATDGKNYRTTFYNLEAIIALGYRVRSHRGTQFRQIFMRDWRDKLKAFLQFNEWDILKNPGKVSKAVADHLALEQYDIFRRHRQIEEARNETLSDDAELKRFLEDKK